MNHFNRLNNIVGWVVFAITFIVYTLTVERTASFWDCGEFIACAYKLQVPHPPGAPFFLLIGRLFSMLALGDVTKVAFFVNMLTVLASAFTVLFLFWTISMLARKTVGKLAHNLDKAEIILVLGASAVGALAYAFTDSFWFSAGEAEVYGMSSFFTAIVVWAAFKWELIEDQAAANRWLLFIAYLTGLSIGVHLLNLVTLPALALIYYFKKAKNVSWGGGILAAFVGVVILGIINVGIIPGLPSMAGSMEIMFVNSFGLPFGSGMIIFVVLLVSALVFGIRYTANKQKVMANLALLSLAFVLIGYSSYILALVRSNANPPINENNPSNLLNYISYLKREQYGTDRSLLYGPNFTARPTDMKQGEAIYKRGKDKYEVYDHKFEYVWDSGDRMLFPRISSQQGSHAELYREMLGLAEGEKPTMKHNLSFFFQHQLGTMYWRYFMWNFAGRESDNEGAGWTKPWESSKDLPSSLADNKGRSNYFWLPFILGLIGLVFQLMRRERDFIVTFLLFLMTGAALVVFLNSPPVEPRERDYIYVGSFYFFCIWLGLGVMAIADGISKFIKDNTAKAGVATALGLMIPAILITDNWASHDRSHRYHSVDFAKNLLSSCAKNAILFTGGDNDTFPLWYVQEVEGFRTDVRVCNLSLLGTDWYIDQMKRKTYESEALPISLGMEHYISGVNDQIPFYESGNEQIKSGISLKEYLDLIRTNNPAIKVPLQSGEEINILPSENLFFPVNVEEVKKMGIVAKDKQDYITPVLSWKIGKRDLLKPDLIMLDIIANNDWKRPIYFSGTLASENYLNLKEYMQVEGYTYRLLPVRVEGAKDGYSNEDLMYENLMKKSVWRELDNPKTYYDDTYKGSPVISARLAFMRLAEQYIKDENKAKAKEVMDYCLKVIPDKAIPYDQTVPNFVTLYHEVGDGKTANQIAETMAKRADENLAYYIKYKGDDTRQIQVNLYILQMLASISKQYNQNDAAKRYEALYNKHYAKVS